MNAHLQLPPCCCQCVGNMYGFWSIEFYQELWFKAGSRLCPVLHFRCISLRCTNHSTAVIQSNFFHCGDIVARSSSVNNLHRFRWKIHDFLQNHSKDHEINRELVLHFRDRVIKLYCNCQHMLTRHDIDRQIQLIQIHAKEVYNKQAASLQC